MLPTNCKIGICYAEMSVEDLLIGTTASSSSGSNPELPDPSSASISEASEGEDLFTAHWPVESLWDSLRSLTILLLSSSIGSG
jgi:hypothetical protein